MGRLFLYVAMILAAPALAGQPSPAKPAPADDNPLTCRTEILTGSIIPQRTCRTRKQWQQLKTETERATDDALNAAHRKDIAPGMPTGQ